MAINGGGSTSVVRATDDREVESQWRRFKLWQFVHPTWPVFFGRDTVNRRSLLSGGYGAIQVLRNADGVGGCQIFRKKALRRCNVQCY